MKRFIVYWYLVLLGMNSGQRKYTKSVFFGKTRKLDHSLKKRIPELYNKLIQTSILARSDEICSFDDKILIDSVTNCSKILFWATRTLLILFMLGKSYYKCPVNLSPLK